MEQTGNQQAALGLAFGVHHGPRDAPVEVVAAMLDDDAEVLDVMMMSSGSKQAYIAACLGISESYVSRMRKGSRPIPSKFVGPLCGATGSNLLRQVREMRVLLGREGRAAQVAYLLRSAA